MILGVLSLPGCAMTQMAAASPVHPQASPYDAAADAKADVDAALARARVSSHRTILIFGANWCHDSRSLAGRFATPRFAAMLADRYEVVFVDVGQRDRNLDLAKRFGLDGIAGTPTVLVLDSDGRPLNLADAPSWRNADSRSDDAIYAYFAAAMPGG